MFTAVYFLSFQLGIVPEEKCILQGAPKAGDKEGTDQEEMKRETQALAPRVGESPGNLSLHRNPQVKTASIPICVLPFPTFPLEQL